MFQEIALRLQSIPPVVLVILSTLDLILRGLALWRSARRKQQYWFVALLIINSVGILPLIYLAFFDKDKKAK